MAVDEVRNLTNMFLLVLAHAPASLYNVELQSARFVLDDTRTELIKIMYRRLGVVYAKRYKHFSEVLPQDWIADLERTYMQKGTGPLDPAAIAAAMIELFDVLGKHLQGLGDQAGGGFEARWYDRLYEQVKAELSRF